MVSSAPYSEDEFPTKTDRSESELGSSQPSSRGKTSRKAKRTVIRASPIGKSDAPAIADLLEREVFVDGLANLITNRKTQVPLTIGLYGPWGSGKSSFLTQLMRRLPRAYPVARFNPWRLSGGEVWPGLIAEIAPLIDKNLGLYQRARFLWSSDATRGVGKWHTRFIAALKNLTNQIAALAGLTALIFATTQANILASMKNAFSQIIDPALSNIQPLIGTTIPIRIATLSSAHFLTFLSASVILAVVGVKFIRIYRRPFSTQFRANMALYASRPSDLKSVTFKDFEALRHVIGDFSAWRIKRNQPCLVVLIDDLDRCSPDQVIGVLEAVNSFVAELPIVTVIAMDTKFVCNAVAAQHQFLFSKDDGPETKERYGRLFLEKIVHIPFQIPSVRSYQRYVNDLLKITEEDVSRESSTEAERKKRYDPQLFEAFRTLTLAQKFILAPWIGYMDMAFRLMTFGHPELKYSLGISLRVLLGLPPTPAQDEWLALQDYSRQMFFQAQREEFERTAKTILGFRIVAFWKVGALARARAETAAVTIQEEDRSYLREHTGNLRGNPRSIKRFVNTYLLAKGIGALSAPTEMDYRLEDLAAWLVLLQNWPHLGSELCANALAHLDVDDKTGVTSWVKNMRCPLEMIAFVQSYQSSLDRLARSRSAMNIAQCFSFYDVDAPKAAAMAVSQQVVL